jgi:hypothetical protein
MLASTHQGKRLDYAALVTCSSVFAALPAWIAAKRPASAVQRLEVQWTLPLRQLQQAMQQHWQDTSESAHIYCEGEYAWQGRVFQLLLQLKNAGRKSTDLGLFMRLPDLVDGNISSVSYSLTIKAASLATPRNNQQQHSAAKSVGIGPVEAAFESNNPGKGSSDLVCFREISTWAAAEAKLRELGLVHSDGCLHIEGLVTKVV